MSRHFFCTLVAAFVLGAMASARAQPPRNPPPAPSSGKFLAIPGLAPLSMEGVLREIAITPEQKLKLKAVSDGYAAQVQQLEKSFRGFSPEEQKARAKDLGEQIAQFARSAQRKAEAILTPRQLQSVQKIAFQLSAGAALVDPALQEKIGLTAEQRRRLNLVYDQAAEKVQQLQRDTAERVMQLLDDEEAAELKKQLNPPPR
jgi:hypothetical protein